MQQLTPRNDRRPSRTTGIVAFGCMLGLMAVACGGSTPAPQTAPPVGQGTVPEEGAGQTMAARVEEQHRTFVEGCSSKAAASGDYCECAWGETRKGLTDEEIVSGQRPDTSKLEKVRAGISSTCASKLPEEAVKQGFAAGCSGDRPDMQAYCDCSWTEYRKAFSPAELASDDVVRNERFLAARKSVVQACAAQMPESVAKEDFMNGCNRDAKAAAFCDCAWTELRKIANAGEIEAGTFDKATYAAKTDKACGKLRDGGSSAPSSNGASTPGTTGKSPGKASTKPAAGKNARPKR